MEDVELPINFQFKGKSGYLVVVRAFLLGQFRLQLCKGSEYDIVRECCTYLRPTAIQVKDSLIASDDPEAYLEGLSKPWNCEGKKLRIRLDNKAEDVVGPWEPWLSANKKGPQP